VTRFRPIPHGAILAAAVALPLAIPLRPLEAQTGAPEFVLSITGGYTFGRALWGLRQQVVVPEPGPLLIDTFALSRSLAPGFSGWVGLTWYPRPGIGFGADFGWVAAQARTGCAILGTPQPDYWQQNTVACTRLAQDRYPTSALPLLATVTLRAAPARDYSPYLKAGIGPALLGHAYEAVTSHSTNETCVDCFRVIVEAPNRMLTWAGILAAGVAVGGRTGYRLRAEARDVVLGLPVLTGPADPLAEHPVAPTGIRAVHRVTFAFGLDIVLNGPRRRRY
jgi:hypothetical protein